MALPPQLQRSHRYGSAEAAHTLEFYVDAVCPFSGKQLKGINEHLIPLVDKNPQKLSLVLRQYPQPWHSSSTLTHQALLAASRLKPDKFWKYATDLFERQSEFYDEPTLEETPRKTRERLAELAHESIGVDQNEFLDLILTGKGNSGSKVDADLKLAVKVGRQNSIHVTPTVVFDGVVEPSISSSFGAKEWKEFYENKIA